MIINIGFSKPAKPTLHGNLIMFIDNCEFDHAYIRYHSNSLDRDIIYQSIWKGVEFVGNSVFRSLATPVEEYELDITDFQYKSLMQFCIDNSGKSYDLLGVLGLGLSKILKKIHININNPVSNGTNLEFCSEIIARCLNQVDSKDFSLDAENVSPKDLNIIVKSLGLKRLI